MNSGEIILSRHFDVSLVKGLLFDIDGTLSDTDDHLVDWISNRLKPFAWLHKDRDTQHMARAFVMAIETPANFFYHLADRLHLDKPLSQAYDRLSRTRHGKISADERFWLIPGVISMLDYFFGKLPMAVVSARDERTTLHFLEHFDLFPYFEVVVTAQTCIHTKPFPDPVIYASQQMGVDPAQCVMIGDTIVDVRAGKSAGAQTSAVLCGFGSQQELERAGADMIVEMTPDIQSLFAF